MAQICRTLTAGELEAFDRDGCVLIKKAVAPALVESLRDALDSVKASERPKKALGGRNLNATPDTPGEFWGESFCWRVYGESYGLNPFREAVLNSDLGALAGQALRSSKASHIFDQILVKEPGAGTPTLWHHDATYWPIMGEKIATAWVALDHVTAETGAMKFVRGSHKWGERFNPVAFSKHVKAYDTPLPKIPDIDSLLEQGDPKIKLTSFDYEPGDVSIHHGLLVHMAPANTSGSTRRRAYITRWAGDGVIWDPRPGIQPFLDPHLQPGDELEGSELFPTVWRCSSSSDAVSTTNSSGVPAARL